MSRTASPFEPLIDAVESAAALDRVGKPVAKQVRSLVKQPLKDALSGSWLGHALHPLLTDVVVGSFMSATVLDLLGGDDASVRKLIGVGIAAYGPTALTGVNDWADTEPVDDGIRRAGLVHAASNTTALALYALSLKARRNGHRARARALGLAGAGALGAAGFLGGHLSFTKGVGPNQTVFDSGPGEWTDAGEAPQDTPARVVVEDTPVLLVRAAGSLYALHDRCSHRGCSLAEGELDGLDIVCACHGSRFDVRDGSVKQGPATAPQPAFETRERDGRIEIRRAG